MKYRAEIDGLRAVAVLPVILFHAGFAAFGGGFVGVDVFFVISGYLITSIIVEEKSAGTFTIAGFYERRARRILPALFLVVAVCLPFAWAWMLPYQLEDFSQSVIAVCLFVSNILFHSEGGYFAAAAELKPLLHTWSLAVEEQFYVVFPIVVVLAWRFGIRALVIVISVVALASFAAAQVGGNFAIFGNVPPADWRWHSQPSWASFYLATGRAWELMLGALAAFYLRTDAASSRAIRQIASFVGLAVIAYSVFAFDKFTPFPSAHTLVPVFGTFLIIVFADRTTFVGRLLSLRPLVGIGLISYSAYLWHQPLFAFARIRLLNDPGVAVYLLLSVLSLVLAWLSWRYVERPFRSRRNLTRPQLFGLSAFASMVLIGVGVTGHFGKGFSARLPDESLALLEYRDQLSPLPRFCDVGGGLYLPPDARCTLGADVTPTIAVVGDSHAREIAWYVAQAAEGEGLGVKVLVHSACPPVQGIYRAEAPGSTCTTNNTQVLDYLENNEDITHIVLLARWTLALDGHRFDNGEGGKEHGDPAFIVPLQAPPTTADMDIVRGRVELLMFDSIRAFIDTGKTVVLVYPVPEVGWHVPDYLARAEFYGERSETPLSTSYARYLERNGPAIELFDSYGELEGLRRVLPAEHLCNTSVDDRCVAERGGKPLYFDDDHLNELGVAPVIEDIMRHVREPAVSASSE